MSKEQSIKFSESKQKNIKIDKLYKSFNGKSEQDILNYFGDKTVHCVKCKTDLPADPEFSYPVVNNLSISLRKADNSVIHAVPYLICDTCKYNNSVLKLLQQI